MHKILFISHSSSLTGGGEEDFVRLLKFFHTRYNITGIFPEGENIPKYQKYVSDYLIIPNIMLPFTGFNLILYIKFILKSLLYKRKIIKNFLKGRKFDLIYIHSSVCYYEFLSARKFNPNIVIVAREVIMPQFIRRFIYKSFLKNVSKIVCVSNFVKEFFTPLGDNGKLKVIPCAIEEIKLNHKKRYISSNNKEFIIIGNIHPLKNQDTVIKAIRHLNNSEISLTSIGGISDPNYYQSLIDDNQDLLKSGQIKFIGELERNMLLEKIDESFAVIIASNQEGFSLVFLEACQLSKPVITTPVGIMKEIVSDGENGLIFKPGNYEMLSLKMKLLLDNDNLYNKIGSNASISTAKFSVEKMLVEYEKLFKDVCSK